MSIFRRHIKSILIPVVVAVVSVPVADVAFRLAGARPSDDLGGLFSSFGEGGFRHRENVKTSTDWYSGPFTVLTDGLGLRCGTSPLTQTQSGMNVDYLILGDSQGFGQCLDYEVSLVGRFAALAAKNGKRVANCSVGGHYLSNQLEVARWLHDDNFIGINTVIVLLTPYLIATSGGYNRVVVTSDGKLFRRKPTIKARLALWAKTNTVIFGRVRDAVRNLTGLGAGNNVIISVFDTGERQKEHTQALLRALGDIQEWANSIQASLEIAYTPLAVELDFASVLALAAQKDLYVNSEVPLTQAREVTKELGLPLLDLRQVLSDLHVEGKPITCKGDPHYNEQASLACAQLLWESRNTTLAH